MFFLNGLVADQIYTADNLHNLYISKNIPSLIMDIAMTMINGDQAVSGFIGEMTLIDRRIETTKKYTFANLLN